MLIFGNEVPVNPHVERIAAGLGDPDVGKDWRRIAQVRVRELRADRMDYGLRAEEARELDQLERLLAAHDGAIAPEFWLAIFLFIALGTAATLALWNWA